jgi:hypothetical protein
MMEKKSISESLTVYEPPDMAVSTEDDFIERSGTSVIL